jgi:hypothetical protein
MISAPASCGRWNNNKQWMVRSGSIGDIRVALREG